MKVGTKLSLVVALMAFVVLTVGSTAFYAARISHEGLYTVYNDEVEPLEHLKYVSDMYAVKIVETTHKTCDGAISWENARKELTEAQTRITEKWKQYLATNLDPKEKKLVNETLPLIKQADGAVAVLKIILDNEDRDELVRFAATKLYPAIDPVTRKLNALVDIQLVIAQREFQKSEFYYHNGMLFSLVLMLSGVLISGWFAIVVIRQLLHDLGGEPAYVRQIAQSAARGDLSVTVVVDESKKRSVLWAMKVMVAKLNDLMGEKDLKNLQLENMKQKLDERVEELEATLDQIKQLEGIIPICMHCKKIRDDQDSWHQLEAYISKHSDAMFSHSVCPECLVEQMEIIRNMK